MMFWMIAGVESFLQLGIGIGLYARCSGEDHCRKKWAEVLLVVFLVLLFAVNIYDKKFSIISTSSTLLLLVPEAFWLWLWFGGSLIQAVCWSFFVNWSITLLKMPALLICGMISGEGIAAVNNVPEFGAGIIKCLMLVWLFLSCFYGNGWVKKALTVVFRKRGYLFFWCGLGEMGLTIYLFVIIRDSFRMDALLLNILILVCLYLTLLLTSFYTRYRLSEKVNRMYLSKERQLKTDYELLRREQENNRKIYHDHKYDLAYLLECLKEEKWEEGTAYIEKRLEAGRRRQKSEVWTGHGCIDFLIGNAKVRAEENEIRFCVDVDITKIPIAEYELFTILGNLLDNAFEAAEKCRRQERFVNLKLHMRNEMFVLALENSYLTEPMKKKGKLLSTKEGEGAHGWGLENVKELVEKNNGLMHVSYENHVFQVQLMIGG